MAIYPSIRGASLHQVIKPATGKEGRTDGAHAGWLACGLTLLATITTSLNAADELVKTWGT